MSDTLIVFGQRFDNAEGLKITNSVGATLTFKNTGYKSYSSSDKKLVNFIDYDGTICYSYTSAEFANLSALPPNPTHEKLTSQGWNWTLAEIQARLTAVPGGEVVVGQMYATASGNTEIDIDLDDPDYLTPYLEINGSSTNVTVYWGDGTNDTYTSNARQPHTYSSTGKYTISIKVNSGTQGFYQGGGNNYTSILYVDNQTGHRQRITTYSRCIKAIRLADNFRFTTGSFRGLPECEYITIPNTITQSGTNVYFMQCVSLKSITIPRCVTTVGYSLLEGNSAMINASFPATITSQDYSVYSGCRALRMATVPSGITSIGNYYVYLCLAMKQIILPSGITTIGNMAFQSCQSLTSLTIPATVTTIGTDAFRYNYNITEYHFLSSSPPSLGNTTVFGGIASNCVIYVPQGKVNDYKTATNWTEVASYIQEEPT